MLAACASSRASAPASPPIAPDPIVEVRERVQLVCPDELAQPAPTIPPVPADAEVTANEPGAAWIGAVVGAANMAIDRLVDAGGACAEQLALEPDA